MVDEELEDILIKEENDDQITYKDEKTKNTSLNMKNPINKEFSNENEIEPKKPKKRRNKYFLTLKVMIYILNKPLVFVFFN